ncbi:IS4-like element IS231D family transposase [Bacillus paranthracis]|uniref:Transposase for insertion sequence element IS231D n=1 Tax=Bacillus thuringiensis subsp. finitimus TaxID=29337 RepID=T231D_BACTF|nr:IS4-like element IS231D family transposase [Bacillus paranthracis]Q05501.1 RecName: Full=Transposase for insertion sequence element IS231D [Bacillus thuringiensis serovar finitimus]ADY24718.1 transposase [Bacillus thuringiensis serovar finitimus YBT-020]MRC74780.1 IS4-like element IS231D family transposase [Bacillus thuringiensis]MCR6801164.1 IS4-like element IS231D family transposase [Bacillus paranthracis]MEC3361141.1 IS4-like element IS231D family transposase [Bacillus paranthracis]MED0
MNLSIQDELQLFSEELYHHLTPSLLDKLAKELGFVKRKRKFSGNELATICIWVSQRTASNSLVRLCSQLHAATGTLMSPEGLNKRFDGKAVEFLKYIFSVLWKSKLCETSAISSATFMYFQRIRILDATIFQVPKHLAHAYPGSGGCAQTAGIKIQLEYDLHSGQFLNFQVGPGKNNDKTFGTECLVTLRPGDLCIRDLGYFSLEDLDQMDQRGVYYISRLKLNHTVYMKNPSPKYFRNGTVKKQPQYTQVDLEYLMNTLKPGQTYEIKEAYIGKDQKLFSRVVIYRLTEKQLQERRTKQSYTESKKGITYSKKSKRLTGINIYVTNTPWGIVPMEQIHDFYSLRWQIEIIFKTWKSLFQIHQWQNIKQERLECHVYGRLIAIFLCSSTMFKMRQLLLHKRKRELSEYKAIGMIQDHLFLLFQAIQKNIQAITKIFIRLFTLLKKNGRKSHRYEKKTVFDIMGVIYEYSGFKKQQKVA